MCKGRIVYISIVKGSNKVLYLGSLASPQAASYHYRSVFFHSLNMQDPGE